MTKGRLTSPKIYPLQRSEDWEWMIKHSDKNCNLCLPFVVCPNLCLLSFPRVVSLPGHNPLFRRVNLPWYTWDNTSGKSGKSTFTMSSPSSFTIRPLINGDAWQKRITKQTGLHTPYISRVGGLNSHSSSTTLLSTWQWSTQQDIFDRKSCKLNQFFNLKLSALYAIFLFL